MSAPQIEHCSNPECKKEINYENGCYRFATGVFCSECGDKKYNATPFYQGWAL